MKIEEHEQYFRANTHSKNSEDSVANPFLSTPLVIARFAQVIYPCNP